MDVDAATSIPTSAGQCVNLAVLVLLNNFSALKTGSFIYNSLFGNPKVYCKVWVKGRVLYYKPGAIDNHNLMDVYPQSKYSYCIWTLISWCQQTLSKGVIICFVKATNSGYKSKMIFLDFTVIQHPEKSISFKSTGFYSAITYSFIGTKKDVTYFKNLVISNTDILEGLAKKWDEINNNLQDVSEESKL